MLRGTLEQTSLHTLKQQPVSWYKNCLAYRVDLYRVIKISLFYALLQFCFASATAYAFTDMCAKEEISYRGVTLRLENDSFAKTDRNYSHGLVFTAESHNLKNYFDTECLPWPLRWHSKFFNFITPDFWVREETWIPSNSIVVKFGQSLYTPRNSASSELISNDRPYAGVLYGGLSLHQRYRNSSNLEVLDTREITLGVIGPWSFAKEFQDGVHDLLGDDRFYGWAHQLKNEPAVQIAFDKKFKEYRGEEQVLHGFTVDVIRSIGVRLGNIESSANVGIEGRIGWDIPNDFGSFTIRPGTDSSPPELVYAKNDLAHFGFHFFGILDLKWVGYNFSLDGNLFDSSHRVTREPLVAFSAGGFSFPTIIKKRAYTFAIMQVYQTSDFKEQPDHHAYRSVTMSVGF